jgi:hypothetical protein
MKNCNVDNLPCEWTNEEDELDSSGNLFMLAESWNYTCKKCKNHIDYSSEEYKKLIKC